MCMYLECCHPKFNHDNIIEALMMALIAIRGNSITILIYNFCSTTQLCNYMDRHADNTF